jgi:hypothetical protein
MFSFPDSYGGSQCGIPVTHDHLKEVTELSGLLECIPEGILPRIRECEGLLPDQFQVESNKGKEAYIYELYPCSIITILFQYFNVVWKACFNE